LKLKKFIALIISALFSASLAGAIITLSAGAATFGAGYNSEGGPIGNWIVDGQRTYCIEISSAAPISASRGSSIVTSLTTDPVGYSGSGNPTTTTSGLNLAKANWVLANYGDTSNNRQAAAVQLWIWTHLSYNEFVARGSGSFSVSWNYHLGWVPSAQRNAVVNIYNNIEAAVNQAVTALPSAAPSISASKDLYAGTVDVALTGNAAWKGSLALSSTAGDVEFSDAAMSVAVTGGSKQQVSFTRDSTGSYDFKVSGTLTSWPARIRVWNRPSTWQQMTVGAASSNTTNINLEISGENDNKFLPELSTAVQHGPEKEHVRTGSYLVDRVSLRTTAESMDWPQSAEKPVNIKLRYTIYGPFNEKPTQASTPPDSAPIFETDLIDSSGDSDLLQQSSSRVNQPGWYSWVWSIAAADQEINLQHLMPDSYNFTDDFADPSETIAVREQVSIQLVTKAGEEVHAPGGPLSDLITVTTNGAPWSQDANGDPLELKLRADVWELCDATSLPTVIDTTPENATKIFSKDLVITGPGEYLVSSGAGIPGSGCAGYGTWQVSVLPVEAEVGPHSHWLANSSDPASHPFFLPEESFQISPPVFSSITDDLVLLGESSRDSLMAKGLVLGAPYSEWQISEWQLHLFEYHAEVSSEICDSETLIRVSDQAIPIDSGNYSGQVVATSKPETISEKGKYQWVALIENLVTGESILHGCGELSQQFIAVAPPPAFAHSGVDDGELERGTLTFFLASLALLIGLSMLMAQLSRRTR